MRKYIFYISLIALVISCNDDANFEGKTGRAEEKKPGTEDGAKGDDDQAPDKSTPVAQEDSDQTGKNTSVEFDDDEGIAKRECTQTLDYDPQSIQCNINVKTANTDWMGSWRSAIQSFTDSSASFLSPLEQVRSGDNIRCKVPGVDKLIFVSHFVAKEAGTFKIEAINDNTGKVRLWRNARSDGDYAVYGKPTQDGFRSTGEVDLAPGHYSVVVDTLDRGETSALALSIRGPDGKVVRNTTPGGWCIFRVGPGIVVEEFVPQAAGCRECFVGKIFSN